MIALDTNLVIRLVTEDDPLQVAEVNRVIGQAAANGETCLVTDIVLCELEWVLTGHPYNGSRTDVLTATHQFLADPLIEVEDAQRLRRALDAYQQGRGDLSDHLLGEAAVDLGARTTFTFDKALRGHPAFTVLSS